MITGAHEPPLAAHVLRPACDHEQHAFYHACNGSTCLSDAEPAYNGHLGFLAIYRH